MTSEPYQYGFHNLDDSQLWSALKDGSLEVFEYLYQQHIQSLFDYGMHIHADADLVKDAIQELFIHIWQHRSSLGDVRNIRNYLIVSLRRSLISQLETLKKWHLPMLDNMQILAGMDTSPESRMIAQEVYVQQEQSLITAIEKLPPRQKEIVYLLFYKNFPQKEVARIMSINLASVYTLTSKAIKSLRKHLQ
ncbi:MAG: sigma-70 family RNA polymerase sigma factor [Cyclobacteriaceae bacterium]